MKRTASLLFLVPLLVVWQPAIASGQHPPTPVEENVGGLVKAGQAALLDGDFSKAIQVLTRAANLDPASYDAAFFRAQAFSAQGRELFYSGQQNDGYMMLQDAMALFRKASDLNRSQADSLIEIGDILIELGESDEADAAAQEALAREPADARALLIRGDAAFIRFQKEAMDGVPAERARENWREAFRFYENAEQSAPESTGPYLGMAALYEADKKWDEAADCLMNALVLDPELVQGYDRLIALLGNAEGREKLIALLTTLLERTAKKFPGDETRRATPCYYMGFAHFLSFDYEASIQAYGASAKANPAYSTGAAYYTARSWYGLNEYKKASEEFLGIIAKDPDAFAYFLSGDPSWREVCVSLAFLANHCVEAGDAKMARDILAGALMVMKNNPVYYNNYAFLCRETGQYEDAYSAYREALSLQPDNPSILNDTALMLQYHLDRDLDYAEELYARAIQEAQRILEDKGQSAADKEDARIALRDATTNLRKLKRTLPQGKKRGFSP